MTAGKNAGLEVNTYTHTHTFGGMRILETQVRQARSPPWSSHEVLLTFQTGPPSRF